MHKNAPSIENLLAIRKRISGDEVTVENTKKLRAVESQLRHALAETPICPSKHILGAEHDRHCDCDDCDDWLYSHCCDKFTEHYHKVMYGNREAHA